MRRFLVHPFCQGVVKHVGVVIRRIQVYWMHPGEKTIMIRFDVKRKMKR